MSLDLLTAALAERLLVASVAGGMLAVGVWALCRLPGVPAAWRRWMWWAVAAKLLLGLLPLPALPLPMLRGDLVASERWHAPGAVASGAGGTGAATPMSEARGAVERGAETTTVGARPAGLPTAHAARAGGTAEGWSGSPVASVLMLAWALGAAGLLLAGAADAVRAWRLVRAAQPVADPDLRLLFARLCRQLDTPRARLRLSTSVEMPQVVGLLRPVVLLPVAARRVLGAAELEMALAHELVHVRRHDLPLGLVPALAARLFFFHPLARLAEREHALAREAACDAAVVGRYAPSPRDYGRLLLRLAIPARRPLRAAAAAITHQTLQRRLDMLLVTPCRLRPAWGWLAAAALLVALVPLRLTAAPAALATTVLDAREPAAERSETLVAAVAEPAHAGRVASTARSDDATIESEGGGHLSYVLTRRDGHTMDGSRRDLARAESLRRGDADLLWVRRDDEEWVVRDPALVAEAAELFAAQRELGARQGELGARQGELGAIQGELGGRQAELGRQQAQLGAEQAALAAEMARLAARQVALVGREMATDDGPGRRALEQERRDLERERRPIEEGMDELHFRQRELGERQGELGARQAELGSRQGELGAHQGQLGRLQQEAAEKAQRQMRALIERWIAEGRAERVRD